MRVLDLFSGTGSVSKECEKRGYDVISLDRDLPAMIKHDIMTWDYKSAFPIGYFDLITASPVCCFWSSLRASNIGRFGITKETIQRDIDEKGKPMVDKTIEIIEYFKPKYWWIENPQTGRMKEYITNLPYYDLDYCKYGFLYRKRTRFWTNIMGFIPKLCEKDCNAILHIKKDNGKISKIHKKHYNNKTRQNVIETKKQGTSKKERYRIPPNLINELLDLILNDPNDFLQK